MSPAIPRSDTAANSEHVNFALFGFGVLGLGLGVGALMLDMPLLGFGAGLCSLVAAVGNLGTPRQSELPAELAVDEAPVLSMTAAQLSADEGLMLSAQFFDVAVRNRVTAARRFLKPVAVVRLRMLDTEGIGIARTDDVADVVALTLRECDMACILDDHDIALVLEDTPENGAVWVVERVRRALDERRSANVWAGVACYPAHAMSADELLTQADEALQRARDWPQDRIEVAYAD